MIEQDPEAAPLAGTEAADPFGEVVGAVEGLDDDPLHPEVGAQPRMSRANVAVGAAAAGRRPILLKRGARTLNV